MVSGFANLVRTLVTWVVMLPVTGACAVIVIVVGKRDPSSPTIERIIKFWSGLGLRLAGIDLHVIGAEQVDKSRSYVCVANHISMIDIFAHFSGIPVPIRFLAKAELFRIPLLAGAMRAVGIVEVDRKAGGLRLDELNRQATEAIERGRSLIVYPEGTRSRDGVMKPFKKGAFTIAALAELPLLPTTIHGTHEAMPADSWFIHGGNVTLVIDPPVETAGLERQEVGRVRDEVRAIIASRYEELRTRQP